MTNSEYIDEALGRDVELSAEEYRAKCLAADKSTVAHGTEGKAPVSEAIRHKRIQSNFYGIALNVMLSTLAEVSRTNELLSELVTMMHVSMSPAAKEKYTNICKMQSNL